MTPPDGRRRPLPPARPPAPPVADRADRGVPGRRPRRDEPGGQLNVDRAAIGVAAEPGRGPDGRRHRHRRRAPSPPAPSRCPAATTCRPATAPRTATGTAPIVAGIIGAAPDDEPAPRSAASRPTRASSRSGSRATCFGRSDASGGTGVGDVDTLAMAVRTAADAGRHGHQHLLGGVRARRPGHRRPVRSAPRWPTPSTSRTSSSSRRRATSAARASAASRTRLPIRPARATGLGRGAGRGEPGLVRRLRADGRFRRTATGRPSAFTLAGPWVDVAAPGEGVVSLNPDGEGLIDTAPGARRGNADLGHQLCGAGGHGHRRAGSVAAPRPDRTAGDAAHRGHRAPSGRAGGTRGSATAWSMRWPRSAPTEPRSRPSAPTPPRRRPGSGPGCRPTPRRVASRCSGPRCASRSPRPR